MKLKNLIITGMLMSTIIFAGCDGKSETAKEKSPEIQAAWNDILGEESSEQNNGESDDDKDDDDVADDEENSENVDESTDDISEDDDDAAEEEKEGSGKPDTNWYENNGDVITTGIFTVGTDIEAGSYTLTNIDPEDGFDVAVFENMENYLTYYRTDPRDTVGEENDAINANSYYTTYLYTDENATLNLEDGNILKLEGKTARLVNNDETNAKFDLGESKTLKQGVYSSSQLESGTYIVSSLNKTDEDRTLILLFENNDSYKAFNSEEKFTVGEFISAAYKNALVDLGALKDESSIINMTEDSILYVEYDDCYIQKVTMNWSK